MGGARFGAPQLNATNLPVLLSVDCAHWVGGAETSCSPALVTLTSSDAGGWSTRAKMSASTFSSPATRSEDSDPNATVLPSPLMAGWLLSPFPGSPSVATLARGVVPTARSEERRVGEES